MMVLLLAALAAAVAAAVSWYLLPTEADAAAARVVAAGPVHQLVQVHREADLRGEPRAALDDFGRQAGGALPLPGGLSWLGLVQDMAFGGKLPRNVPTDLPVSYRDDFCGHARLTGACPGAGEAALDRAVAGQLGVAVGDRIAVHGSAEAGTLTLKVTGLYVADLEDPYWADADFLAKGGLSPAFTALDTFRAVQLGQPEFAYDVAVPVALLSGDGGFDFNAVVKAARPRLDEQHMVLVDPAGSVASAAGDARYDVAVDVLTIFGQVLALALLALGLAGRFTGRDRRTDAGLLLLRGSNRLRLLGLGSGQYLFPLLGGVLVGWPFGVVAARLLAGHWPLPEDRWIALRWSVAAIGAVLLCGLPVLLLVDLFAHRGPVSGMLRRVPSMRPDWRSALLDAVLVILAAGAVYQVRAAGAGNGLGVIAPVLVALAVGVLSARVLRAIVDRAGAVALRGGRLRAGLTAVQISRQPGADRVFALLVVTVAVFALTVGGWSAGRQERTVRAEVELGAPRVLTVQAESRTQLLSAVRHADPTGRYAMAAAVDLDHHLIAVDTSRLAAVATWRPEYGSIKALSATEPKRLPLITSTVLSLRVDSARRDVIRVLVMVQNETTGKVSEVVFPGVRPGAQTVTVPVSGCSVTAGCRLISIQPDFPLVAGDDGVRPVPGAVVLRGLDQQGSPASILDGAALSDITRWRTDFAGLALDVVSGHDGLRIAPQAIPGGNINPRVYAVDEPLPLPLVVAGPQPDDWRLQDSFSDIFSENHTPVRVVATARALPVLGGQGMMADLDAVRRLVRDSPRPATFQVWLSAGAPGTVITALTRNGLTVVGERTTARRVRELAHDSGAVATPFQLYTAAITLLLAAALLAASAMAERGPLTEQLRALRAQGLPRRTAMVIRVAGTASLAAAGLLGGLLAAVIARYADDVTAPRFADGWQVVPPPGPLGLLAAAVTLLAGLIVLVPAAWLPARVGIR